MSTNISSQLPRIHEDLHGHLQDVSRLVNGSVPVDLSHVQNVANSHLNTKVVAWQNDQLGKGLSYVDPSKSLIQDTAKDKPMTEHEFTLYSALQAAEHPEDPRSHLVLERKQILDEYFDGNLLPIQEGDLPLDTFVKRSINADIREQILLNIDDDLRNELEKTDKKIVAANTSKGNEGMVEIRKWLGSVLHFLDFRIHDARVRIHDVHDDKDLAAASTSLKQLMDLKTQIFNKYGPPIIH